MFRDGAILRQEHLWTMLLVKLKYILKIFEVLSDTVSQSSKGGLVCVSQISTPGPVTFK